MPSTASRVRKLLSEIGENVVFTTRHFLKCGTRSGVDHALSRMVNKQQLTRLAAGVFVLATAANGIPPESEIAGAKAQAFGKRILVQTASDTFRTDGCRSSFVSVHGRLYFVPVSSRELNGLVPEYDSAQSRSPTDQALTEASPAFHMVMVSELPCWNDVLCPIRYLSVEKNSTE